MPRYSEERRQAVVTKLLPPHNLSPQVIAEQYSGPRNQDTGLRYAEADFEGTRDVETET